jgi:hypothetical protein
MSAGFYRNIKKGEKNEWIVTYDEVLVVTKGALTVRFADGAKIAKAGEIIVLTKGTKIAYEAAEDDTEAVDVTYPHWMDAQTQSEHADLLDTILLEFGPCPISRLRGPAASATNPAPIGRARPATNVSLQHRRWPEPPAS